MNQAPMLMGQVRFDLSVGSARSGRDTIERVSAFGRQRLPALLARVLEQVGDGQRERCFERIELDLGELPAWRLEPALEERLERLLCDYLRGAGCMAVPDAGDAAAGPARQRDPDWTALCAYLEGKPVRAPLRAFAAALAQWPLEVRQLVCLHGRRQAVRQRLAHELPERSMHALIRVLEPVEAASIIAYVGDVTALHRQRPLAPEGQRAFGMAMWEFVLAYLLLDRGSYFNTRVLVEHTLRQLARRHRLDYAELLSHMTSCIDGQLAQVSDRPGLRAMLLELRDRESRPAPSARAAAGPLARIAALLESGAWSGPAASQPSLGALMAEVIETDPDGLAALVRRAGQRQQVRQRLAGQLDEDGRRQLVGLLEPVHGPWIAGVADAVRLQQARRRVVHEDGARFGCRLWEFILGALLVERGSHFNQRSFIGSLVRQMAAHYNVAYRVLLNGLIGAEPPGTRQLMRRRGLWTILLSLRAELAPAAGADSVPPSMTGPGMDRTVRALALREMLGGGLRAVLAAALRDGAARAGVELNGWLAALLQAQPRFEQYRLQRQALGQILHALSEELDAGQAPPPATPRAPAPPRFDRAAREFVLRSFGLERGSYFNNRSYIKQLLQQLSARHGIGYAVLLHGLLERAAGAGDSPASLPAILRQLRAESAPAAGIGAGRGRAGRASGPAAAPWEFLRDGALIPGAETLLRAGLDTLDPPALAAALRDAAFPLSMLERLLRYLSDARLLSLAECLSEGAGGLAATWVMAILALHGRVPMRPGAAGGLREAAWRSVLRVLLRKGGGEFSGAAFLAAVTGELAPRLGLALATLRRRLAEVAAQQAGTQARYRILLELLGVAGGKHALPVRQPGPQASATSTPGPNLGGLAERLRFGTGNAGAAALGPQLEQLLASPPDALRTWLRAHAGRQLESARLASFLNAAQLRRLLDLLLGRDAARFGWWCETLAGAAAETAGGGEWEGRLSRLLLAHAVRAGGGRADLQLFLRAALRMLGAGRGVPGPAVWRRVRLRAQGAGAAMPTRPALDLVERMLNAPAPAPAAAPGESAPPALAEGERFAVDNAGVVLLWPFLERYFSTLGMLADGQFLDEERQHRALELLRHLTHGEPEAPEHAQLLAKILCGLAPEQPLLPGAPLTESELSLSAQLLHVVTQHWEKLRNTDAEGLQLTFLRRAGYLERVEQGWKLTVPRESFDMLLASLPWALSTIRLSWMQCVLTVEWA